MEHELNVTIEGITKEQAGEVLKLITLLVEAFGGTVAGGIAEVGDENSQAQPE